MATVQLSDDLVSEAKQAAKINHRSLPKQIEYWARIGKADEEKNNLATIKKAALDNIIARYGETFEILSK
jgi:ParD-like antitoxin of type II bacterial toxin-antitoxin system